MGVNYRINIKAVTNKDLECTGGHDQTCLEMYFGGKNQAKLEV